MITEAKIYLKIPQERRHGSAVVKKRISLDQIEATIKENQADLDRRAELLTLVDMVRVAFEEGLPCGNEAVQALLQETGYLPKKAA